MRFNPPPGWPLPPPGWEPPEDWTTPENWPLAPPDWQFWVEDGPVPTPASPVVPTSGAGLIAAAGLAFSLSSQMTWFRSQITDSYRIVDVRGSVLFLGVLLLAFSGLLHIWPRAWPFGVATLLIVFDVGPFALLSVFGAMFVQPLANGDVKVDMSSINIYPEIGVFVVLFGVALAAVGGVRITRSGWRARKVLRQQRRSTR